MLEKIKTHVKTHKFTYISGGAGLVVGAVATVLLTNRGTAMNANMARIFSPGENNLVQIFLAPLGHPGNVVQCLETGSTYASQGELARTLGVEASTVSRHLGGHIEDLFGKHYTVLGKAGQPLAG